MADPTLSQRPADAGRRASGGPGPSRRGGGWLVAGLLLLGLAAATTGVLFQRQQTRRCLGFYGPAAARRITTAPGVSLQVVEASGPAAVRSVDRRDVSRAAGLVHLRRGLVEDANFAWPEGPPSEPLGPTAWDYAIEFSDAATGAVTTLVLDLDPGGGSLAVVGSPGRVGLGRIAPGLAKWIRDTLETTAEPAKEPVPAGRP